MQEKGERRMEKGASTMVAILTAGESEQRQKERKREKEIGNGADRERSLSIADEFNGIAFQCIPVELAARGPSKSIRENLFGVVHAAFRLPPFACSINDCARRF